MKSILFVLGGVLLGCAVVSLYFFVLAVSGRPDIILMSSYLEYLLYGSPRLHELEAQLLSFWQSVNATLLEWSSLEPKELLDQLGTSLQGHPQTNKDPP